MRLPMSKGLRISGQSDAPQECGIHLSNVSGRVFVIRMGKLFMAYAGNGL